MGLEMLRAPKPWEKYLYNPLQNVKEKEIPNVKNSYNKSWWEEAAFMENLLCARHCAKVRYPVDEAGIW